MENTRTMAPELLSALDHFMKEGKFFQKGRSIIVDILTLSEKRGKKLGQHNEMEKEKRKKKLRSKIFLF